MYGGAAAAPQPLESGHELVGELTGDHHAESGTKEESATQQHCHILRQCDQDRAS
jgi:hypothetical protein